MMVRIDLHSEALPSASSPLSRITAIFVWSASTLTQGIKKETHIQIVPSTFVRVRNHKRCLEQRWSGRQYLFRHTPLRIQCCQEQCPPLREPPPCANPATDKYEEEYDEGDKEAEEVICAALHAATSTAVAAVRRRWRV